jgi:glycerophosphoryl diester phosphodiesterase
MWRALREALFGVPRGKRGHAFFGHERPLAIAHRGGLALWPENTIFAFGKAVEAGIDGLEMDVHKTKDGVIVVSHDPEVDRCTNGTGAIKNLTLAEVQDLDAGYRFTPDDGKTFPFRDKGIRIPTLAEVFEAFPDQRFVIDNKPDDADMAQELAELVLKHGLEERVILASFYVDNLYRIRERYPQIATSASEIEVYAFYPIQLLRLGGLYRSPARAFQVPSTQHGIPFLTRHFVKTAHRKDMDVHVWIINDEDEMRHLLEIGVNGIVSDYPERVVEIVRQASSLSAPTP